MKIPHLPRTRTNHISYLQIFPLCLLVASISEVHSQDIVISEGGGI